MRPAASPEQLAERVLAGDRRATGRALTLVEDRGPAAAELLRWLYPHTGAAHLVGVTGSPGVGKSSLIDALVGRLRKDDLKVGVLAVDPTSPYTGGALLGDRIRMMDHALDTGVFIRSMGSRGHAGGVALATREAARVLEAYGCQVIFIETVGAGQNEWAIARLADTIMLVLNPESGDDVQAIKAGIMEIADVYVVNKADMPAAIRTQFEVQAMLNLAGRQAGWRPPVLLTETVHPGRGIDDLWQQLLAHRRRLEETGELQTRRREQLYEELLAAAADRSARAAQARIASHPALQETLDRLADRRLDPSTAAAELVGDQP